MPAFEISHRLSQRNKENTNRVIRYIIPTPARLRPGVFQVAKAAAARPKGFDVESARLAHVCVNTMPTAMD